MKIKISAILKGGLKEFLPLTNSTEILPRSRSKRLAVTAGAHAPSGTQINIFICYPLVNGYRSTLCSLIQSEVHGYQTRNVVNAPTDVTFFN